MAMTVICPQCGSRVEPEMVRKGNLRLQIVLWFCFILPGLLYSMWRESTRKLVCPECQYGELNIQEPETASLKSGSSATLH